MKHSGWFSGAVALFGAMTIASSGEAQIVPAATMRDERSTVSPDATFNGVPLQVTINGVVNPVDVITDGARRGNNVFHSFSQSN